VLDANNVTQAAAVATIPSRGATIPSLLRGDFAGLRALGVAGYR